MIRGLLVQLGFDPIAILRRLGALPRVMLELNQLAKQRKNSAVPFAFGRFYPCLEDRTADGGTARGHYFHQDLLVARRIHQNNPVCHVDVGSRVDGFVAHVASFRPIVVLDIRPNDNPVANMTFLKADLMHSPGEGLLGMCDSLSCLHALEHFGLGRYGDTLDHDGYLVGLKNLGALLKKAGKFYLSVPIGPQRIEFNAHRVFSIRYLLSILTPMYRVDRFSFIGDDGALREDVSMDPEGVNSNFGCRYGCGIFELTKLM